MSDGSVWKETEAAVEGRPVPSLSTRLTHESLIRSYANHLYLPDSRDPMFLIDKGWPLGKGEARISERSKDVDHTANSLCQLPWNPAGICNHCHHSGCRHAAHKSKPDQEMWAQLRYGKQPGALYSLARVVQHVSYHWLSFCWGVSISSRMVTHPAASCSGQFV